MHLTRARALDAKHPAQVIKPLCVNGGIVDKPKDFLIDTTLPLLAGSVLFCGNINCDEFLSFLVAAVGLVIIVQTAILSVFRKIESHNNSLNSDDEKRAAG